MEPRFELKLYRKRWAAVWYEGGKIRRHSLGTALDTEGKRRFVDFVREQARAGDTVAEIVAAYMADKADGPSVETNRFAWKALAPHFGYMRPDQVTRRASRDYIAARRQLGRSDNTIQRELSVLLAALRWQDRNTPAIVELPPKPPPRDRYLTREEYARLRAAAVQSDTFHVRLFIELAYATAGRREAVLELTWNRVDLTRGLVNLATGEHSRKRRAEVPIEGPLVELLRQARAGALTDYVIEWKGRPVASIRTAFDRVVRASGLEDVSPHVLRHSAAVHMAEEGIPMSEIAQFLGHASTKMTERVYARYSPEYLRRASRALVT